MRLPKILAIILAGGKGSRLGELTEHRAKPSLPIGGTYRLVDISLSNLAHSNIKDVLLAVQYLPHTITQELQGGRPWDLDASHGGLELAFPFQGQEGEGFNDGNSATLFSQIPLIERYDPDLVLVLSADHLYLVNYLEVLNTHQQMRADLTMVSTEVTEHPGRYSVIKSHDGLVTAFDYKPDEPEGNVVGCEIFLFEKEKLVSALRELEKDGLEDYGHDLLPYFVENHRVADHRHKGYWLDLGTIQSYWTAHMQILNDEGIRLDDPQWPIWSAQPQRVPARVTGSATLDNASVCAGSKVSGTVINSVIGVQAVVEEGAVVENSVVLDGARIKSGAVVKNAIVSIDAEVSGRRGSDEVVTLIGVDGCVAERQPFDYEAELPGFAKKENKK